MAYIREKITKSGKYYYLVESHRVNGKVVKEETYLGTKPPWPKSPRYTTVKVPKEGGGYRRVTVESKIKKINTPLCSECQKLLDTVKVGQEFNLCSECEAKVLALMGQTKVR